jgi:hypothetical protein
MAGLDPAIQRHTKEAIVRARLNRTPKTGKTRVSWNLPVKLLVEIIPIGIHFMDPSELPLTGPML